MTTRSPWHRFLAAFLITFGGLGLLLCALLFWANPYRNIPFAPSDRPLMDVNQRYLYPAVARDFSYDSAVFGTSSIRLLQPARLEEELGGSFAQLAMNAATAYEQSRLASLFLRTRVQAGQVPKTILFGIDSVWCGMGETYERFTDRPFPPWMYDDDRWNDLAYLFNGKAIEIAGRMIGYELGFNTPTYAVDGYANFLPPRTQYDLGKARTNIYGTSEPKPIIPQDPPFHASAQELAGWAFPTHALMEDLLAETPAETRVLFVFVPYHVYHQGIPGSHQAAGLRECKQRFAAMAAKRGNSMVLDFMRPSPITQSDDNYWDPVHYGVETAAQVLDLISAAVRGDLTETEMVEVLHDGLGSPAARDESRKPLGDTARADQGAASR